jgi:hypothetical protein
MNARRVGAAAGVVVWMVAARVAAADPTETPDTTKAAERPAEGPSSTTAASEGAFLPFTLGPSSRSTYGTLVSGYDGARKVGLYQGYADAHVYGGFSVRAGYASHDLSDNASALLGGRFQFLQQDRHGLDLGVGLFYVPHDVEGEGLIKGSLLLARRLGDLALFSTLSYGQDPEGDDHRAELSAATSYSVLPVLFVGLDARGRAPVFSSDAKHDGMIEPVFDAVVGPFGQYLFGPVVITGQLGLSALVIEGPRASTQPTREAHYGPIGLLGAGLSL